ncbi:protein-L-isoaspartate(D-aspartate) O-methyltransferase [Desulfofustis glycolicus]|uniref:Protein-L-isoaspartate O-methyltransferase n=1 Tax=Desulfofustis glycolicus DSM 9705 TaxID=1121409 RepID=A0A1M5VEP6_9BACT|nr:protein-L-isoaspartate(D-aspartate) O-methyltransferase [Desulfofustis glycolicus]SHH73752.1 protein-L-isoaspartate(D-aspartate) O-methyltransferase [Desulfofustis glycolicus DSM 9705]
MIDRFATIRERMVQEQLVPRGISDPRVLEAMRTVPRHLFVDDALQSRAYGDFPLPIAAGQTISQPYIVASMTEALGLQDDEQVLEIGTGSGYQAAVLSRLCKKVYTVERINSLLASARKVFDLLKYYNISSKLDDGTLGWPECGPFDAIIVTAGGPSIPEPLVEQLSERGRLVIPVGDQYLQTLKLLELTEDGRQIRDLERVRFVDLVGKHGW